MFRYKGPIVGVLQLTAHLWILAPKLMSCSNVGKLSILSVKNTIKCTFNNWLGDLYSGWLLWLPVLRKQRCINSGNKNHFQMYLSKWLSWTLIRLGLVFVIKSLVQPCTLRHPLVHCFSFTDNYSSGKWVPGLILPTSWTKFPFHCFLMCSGSWHQVK